MKLSIALALLLLTAPSTRADDAAASSEGQTHEDQSGKPSPQLIQLERDLAQKQEAKINGLLTPEKYQEFLIKLRAKLDVVMARVPPTPENKGLHLPTGRERSRQGLGGPEPSARRRS